MSSTDLKTALEGNVIVNQPGFHDFTTCLSGVANAKAASNAATAHRLAGATDTKAPTIASVFRTHARTS